MSELKEMEERAERMHRDFCAKIDALYDLVVLKKMPKVEKDESDEIFDLEMRAEKLEMNMLRQEKRIVELERKMKKHL